MNEYRVSKFYTAPTAIRALMKFGDDQTKVGLGIRKQIKKNIEKIDWQIYLCLNRVITKDVNIYLYKRY